MASLNKNMDIINYKPFNLSNANDTHKWIKDIEGVVNILQSFNKLSPQELWIKFNINDNLKTFLNLYLDTAVRSYEKVFLQDKYANGLNVEQQIYRLVYEIVLKLLQIINFIGFKLKSKNPKNWRAFSNYIVNIFDISMCVNVCCLYFHSTSMVTTTLNQYMQIFSDYLKPQQSHYINAFYDLLLSDEENSQLDNNLNDVIHILICVCHGLPTLSKQLVTETAIIKLINMAVYNETLSYDKSSASKEESDVKLITMRLVHLIFLYISQLETSVDVNSNTISVRTIFESIQHFPSFILPLKNIYKIEHKIKLNKLLQPDDYNYVIACLTSCSMNEELILFDSKNKNKISDVDNDAEKEQLDQLVELFPNLSVSILTKCHSNCNREVTKTIDFIFTHGGDDEKALEVILESDNNKLSFPSNFSLPETPTKTNINTDLMKKLTLSLVRTQDEEQEKNDNKIKQLAERYALTPAMAASLLNLHIDEYEDECDDNFDNDDNFQYVKNLMSKLDTIKKSGELTSPYTSSTNIISNSTFTPAHTHTNRMPFNKDTQKENAKRNPKKQPRPSPTPTHTPTPASSNETLIVTSSNNQKGSNQSAKKPVHNKSNRPPNKSNQANKTNQSNKTNQAKSNKTPRKPQGNNT